MGHRLVLNEALVGLMWSIVPDWQTARCGYYFRWCTLLLARRLAYPSIVRMWPLVPSPRTDDRVRPCMAVVPTLSCPVTDRLASLCDTRLSIRILWPEIRLVCPGALRVSRLNEVWVLMNLKLLQMFLLSIAVKFLSTLRLLPPSISFRVLVRVMLNLNALPVNEATVRSPITSLCWWT